MFPYDGNSATVGKRWTPRLNFSNVIGELGVRDEWYDVYHFARDNSTPLALGIVCYRLRASATFRERFELQAFPIDVQDLSVEFESRHGIQASLFDKQWWQGSAPINGQPDAENRQLGPPGAPLLVQNSSPNYKPVVPCGWFILTDEYVMSPRLCSLEGITSSNLSSSRIQYPSLILSLKITRKPTFYLWNVIFPSESMN